MRAIKYLGLILFTTLMLAVYAFGQSSPRLVNYQGRLTNSSGQPLDGVTVDLTFAFYGVESGAAPLYLTVLQEDVVVSGGQYNVLIGSGTITPGTEVSLAAVFQKHGDVWMGIKVDAGSEMAERARIVSAPYALSAQYVDPAFLGAFMGNPDWDGDGYLKTGNTLDCNDGDSSINPGATDDTVDGVDQNCDGFDGVPKIYIFASLIPHSGNLGHRLGADAICQADVALYPTLPLANVRAFISINDSDEIRDMPGNYGTPTDRKLFGPTDVKIADDWADLLDGDIDQSLTSANVVFDLWWSGSFPDGSLEMMGNCGSFTMTFPQMGKLGSPNDMFGGWISFMEGDCSMPHYVLCLAWE